jgi:hypothetical protein
VRVLKENIKDQFEHSYDICPECKDYGEQLSCEEHEVYKGSRGGALMPGIDVMLAS